MTKVTDMTTPKHILSAATVVFNDRGEYVELRGTEVEEIIFKLENQQTY